MSPSRRWKLFTSHFPGKVCSACLASHSDILVLSHPGAAQHYLCLLLLAAGQLIKQGVGFFFFCLAWEHLTVKILMTRRALLIHFHKLRIFWLWSWRFRTYSDLWEDHSPWAGAGSSSIYFYKKKKKNPSWSVWQSRAPTFESATSRRWTCIANNLTLKMIYNSSLNFRPDFKQISKGPSD